MKGQHSHGSAWGQGIITRHKVSGVCAEGQADSKASILFILHKDPLQGTTVSLRSLL